MCGFNNINNALTISFFNSLDVLSYLNRVKAGVINEENQDTELYLKSANELEIQLNIGWVNIPNEYDAEYDVYFGMIESLYIFSAAKQYQMLREISEIKNKPYFEYIDLANKIFEKYYKLYFSAELEMAEIQGGAAKKWLELTS